MKALIGWLLAGLAALLCVVALYLLPTANTADAIVPLPMATPSSVVLPKGASEHIVYLAALSVADTIYGRDATFVEVGDTLGMGISDPYRYLRTDLLAAVTSADPIGALEDVAGDASVDLSDIGESWGAQLREITAALSSGSQQSSGRTGRSSADQQERELLVAGVMGAEDAIRDLRSKLRFITPATSAPTRVRAAELAAAIERQEAYIIGARRKLAGVSNQPIQVAYRTPSLTAAQRSRIEGLAGQLRADTTYILAPEAGRFYGPSRIGVAQIRSLRTPSPQVVPVEGSSPSLRHDSVATYGLEPQGSPELWAMARRVPRPDTVPELSERVLLVSPRD